MSPKVFGVVAYATRDEQEMFRQARETLKSVGTKSPAAFGLDTSLAQVALSLARRSDNEWADCDQASALHPRENFLEHQAADSKPAVWWNVKYKTRWGVDGATISGNPVYMVLLWNEIGRGTDLHQLVDWIDRNPEIVEELTTAVFAAEPPKWRNFLGTAMVPQGQIKIERARRGQVVFEKSCAGCHGHYDKNWDLGTDTTQVRYFAKSRVIDVGTDLFRAQGMAAFADSLNRLAYSKKFGVVTTVQEGYIPPPLEGIWARYPYLHNNSVPNLCVLLTPPESRPTVYYSGAPVVPGRDFDMDCVGYPTGAAVPPAWKKTPANRFDTTREGLSNSGHYNGILRKDGIELYTAEEKRDLVEYLKSL